VEGTGALHPIPLLLPPGACGGGARAALHPHAAAALRHFELAGALLARSFTDPNCPMPDLPLSAPFLAALRGEAVPARAGLLALDPAGRKFGVLYRILDARDAAVAAAAAAGGGGGGGGGASGELADLEAELGDFCLQFNLGIMGHEFVYLPLALQPGGARFPPRGAPARAAPLAGAHAPPVTLATLHLYLAALGETVLGAGAAPAVAAFRGGLGVFCPCPPALLRLCTAREWARLLAEDSPGKWSRGALRACCALELNDKSSPAKQAASYEWLLEVLAGFAPRQRRSFAYFVTAQYRLPAAPGPGYIRVQMDNSKPASGLPSSKTCTNTLHLPPYASAQALREKLLCALEFGLQDLDIN